MGYGLPKWSLKINHLAYADDTILFSSGDRKSIIKMMNVLKDYEVSGQRINKHKSSFYLHDNTPLELLSGSGDLQELSKLIFSLFTLDVLFIMTGRKYVTLKIL